MPALELNYNGIYLKTTNLLNRRASVATVMII